MTSGQTLSLRDGRRLGYGEYGKPDGEPGFYFHGHPGSRLEPQFADEAAADAGVRIIALDRPGYGLSDFQPHRTILDWPRDVGEAADMLGLDRFSVLGSLGRWALRPRLRPRDPGPHHQGRRDQRRRPVRRAGRHAGHALAEPRRFPTRRAVPSARAAHHVVHGAAGAPPPRTCPGCDRASDVTRRC